MVHSRTKAGAERGKARQSKMLSCGPAFFSVHFKKKKNPPYFSVCIKRKKLEGKQLSCIIAVNGSDVQTWHCLLRLLSCKEGFGNTGTRDYSRYPRGSSACISEGNTRDMAGSSPAFPIRRGLRFVHGKRVRKIGDSNIEISSRTSSIHSRKLCRT